MPYTPEQRRNILLNAGYNPDIYDFNELSGAVVKKAVEEPPSAAEVPTTTAISTKKLQETTAIEAAKLEALQSAGPSVLALAAASKVGAATLPLATVPVVGPAIPPIAAAATGIGTYLGARKLQDKYLMPESIQERSRLATQEHPVYGFIGQFIPDLASGNIVQSAKSIGKLPAILKAASLGHRLSAAEKNIVQNLVTTAGLGSAIEGYQQMEQGEFNPYRLAGGAALGMLSAEPNRLTKKLGFVSTKDIEAATPARGGDVTNIKGYLPQTTARGVNDLPPSTEKLPDYVTEGLPGMEKERRKVFQSPENINLARMTPEWRKAANAYEKELARSKQIEVKTLKQQNDQAEEALKQSAKKEGQTLVKESAIEGSEAIAPEAILREQEKTAARRGVDIVYEPEVQVGGQIKAGQSDLKRRVARISKQHIRPGLVGHEVGHNWLFDLKNSKSLADRRLFKKLIEHGKGKIQRGELNEKQKAILEGYKNESPDIIAEEVMVREFEDFNVDEIKNRLASGKEPWLKDMMAHFRYKLGSSDNDVILRYLNSRFQGDAPYGTRPDLIKENPLMSLLKKYGNTTESISKGVERESEVESRPPTELPRTPSQFKDMPDNWQVTVQEPFKDGNKIIAPGYIQVDKIDALGKDYESTNLEALRAEGYNVPDVSELKTGKYTVGQLKDIRSSLPEETGYPKPLSQTRLGQEAIRTATELDIDPRQTAKNAVSSSIEEKLKEGAFREGTKNIKVHDEANQNAALEAERTGKKFKPAVTQATQEADKAYLGKIDELEAFTRSDVERHSMVEYSKQSKDKELQAIIEKVNSGKKLNANEISKAERMEFPPGTNPKTNPEEFKRLKDEWINKIYSDEEAEAKVREKLANPPDEDIRSALPERTSFIRTWASADKDIRHSEIEDNPNFKKWFEGSKIVDENGKPLRVYHESSHGNINIFRENTHFGTSEQANEHARKVSSNRGEPLESRSIYPVYLNIKNPMKGLDVGQSNWYSQIKAAKERGYDGIIYENKVEGDGNSYIAFYPEQIKSATGNRGTFDSNDPDIRHAERESFVKSWASAVDKAKGVNEDAGDALEKYFISNDQHKATYRDVPYYDIRKMRLSKDELRNVGEYLRAKYRNYQAPNINTKEQGAVNYLRGVWQKIQADQIAEGIRKSPPDSYFFRDMLSDEAIMLLTKKAGSLEHKAAVHDWAMEIDKAGIDNYTTAKKNITEYISSLSSDKLQQIPNFKAIQKVRDDYTIPSNLREKDLYKVILKHGRDVARDMAFWKELQSDSKIATLLALPERNNVKKDPNVDPIIQNPDIQNAMKFVYGDFNFIKNPRITALTRLINNALLGPGTGIRNTAQLPGLISPYLDTFQDVKAAWKSLGDYSQNIRRSLEAGARSGTMDMDRWYSLTNPDKITEFLNKGAEVMRKYQGRDALEQMDRIITFGVGRDIAELKIAQAAIGNVQANKWLDKFGKLAKDKNGNWNLDKIAKNFVDAVQGTYDARGLAAGAFESEFAPFFSLSRWSIEKSNRIYKDVVKPMYKEGNFKPFLIYTLGSMLSGLAIRELNELISGRKDYTPSVKEAWDQKRIDYVAASAINLAQMGSYMGFMSELVKAVSDRIIQKENARGPINFPAADFLTDTIGQNITDTMQAIDNGVDPMEAMTRFVWEVMRNSVQGVRLMDSRILSAEDTERSNKFRDINTFEKLTGEPRGDTSVRRRSRINVTPEQEFRRELDFEKAAEMVPGLLKKAIEDSEGDPYKLKAKLRALKTNSYQTMPDPKTMPIKFMNYISFLERTQGSEEAANRLQDYITANTINKAKSKLIP